MPAGSDPTSQSKVSSHHPPLGVVPSLCPDVPRAVLSPHLCSCWAPCWPLCVPRRKKHCALFSAFLGGAAARVGRGLVGSKWGAFSLSRGLRLLYSCLPNPTHLVDTACPRQLVSWKCRHHPDSCVATSAPQSAPRTYPLPPYSLMGEVTSCTCSPAL